MITTGEQFPAAYEAAVLDDWPGRGFDVEISGSAGSPSRSAIEVRPDDGAPWTASVAGGDAARTSSVSGLFPTPNPRVLLVVERGTAFLVDVGDPARHRRVSTDGPVAGVVNARRDGLLLLVTPWAVTALDGGDVRWTSDRLAVEDLRADELDGGWLRGVSDPESDEPREFAVELATGRVVGGSGLR
jgi:hypothetical protein